MITINSILKRERNLKGTLVVQVSDLTQTQVVYFAQCFQNVLFFSLFVVSGSVHIHYLSMNGHLRFIPCIKFKVDSYTGVNAHTMN